MKSSNFVTNRAHHHCEFQFHLSPSPLGNFKNVAIENIADFSNKVILGIDKSKYFAVSTENSFMSLFCLSFCFNVVFIRFIFGGSQGSCVDCSPSLAQNLKLEFRFESPNQLETFLDKVIDWAIDVDSYFEIFLQKMSERALGKTLEESVDLFESDGNEEYFTFLLETNDKFFVKPFQASFEFSSPWEHLQHFFPVLGDIHNFYSLGFWILYDLHQPTLGFSVVNLAFFQLFLHYFNSPYLDFLSEKSFVLIPDVCCSFVESAVDGDSHEVVQEGSGSWSFNNVEAFERIFERVLLRVEDEQFVGARKCDYLELLHQRIYLNQFINQAH